MEREREGDFSYEWMRLKLKRTEKISIKGSELGALIVTGEIASNKKRERAKTCRPFCYKF
jgi:hypothetical protein